MSRLEVLEAVLADMVGQKVQLVSSVEQSGKEALSLSIDDAFSNSYKYEPEPDFSIFISIPSKKHNISLTVSPDSRVLAIKRMIQEREGIPANQMRLRLNSTDLEDGLTVRDANIQKECTLCVLYRLRGGEQKVVMQFSISRDQLAPKYDLDLTRVQDDGKTYMRGEFEYKRPYSWYRYALKVVNKYESNDWLGPNGIRTHTVQGEWPVAYHGTRQSSHNCVQKIVAEGLKPGPRRMYGTGIYTSPSLAMVAKNYAKSIVCKGKTYRYVLQTRVDPASLTVIERVLDGADYWVSPSTTTVRPYGILVQEV